MAFVLFSPAARPKALLTAGDLTDTRSLLPDMIALPGYLLLVVGLLGFSRSRGRGEAQRAWCWTALSRLSLLRPRLGVRRRARSRTEQTPTLVKIVLAAYPSMSIFLVVVTLRIVFNATGNAPAFWLCVAP